MSLSFIITIEKDMVCFESTGWSVSCHISKFEAGLLDALHYEYIYASTRWFD